MKRWLPKSIFVRSLLIVLVPLVILQIVLAIVFYERHWENVTQYLTAAVADEIDALIWMYNSPDVDEAVVIEGDFFQFSSQFLPGGRLPERSLARRPTRVERHLAQALGGLSTPFAIDTFRSPDTIVSIELPDGLLVITIPKKRMESRTTDLFIYWMLGTSLALTLIAAYFVRQQIRPINRLAKAAEQFGRGIIDVNFRPSGAAEVRRAAHAFLAMRERIRRQIQQRTIMLASVSHDLRSPLTRMRLELALLGDTEEVANLKRDIEEMEHMIDVYLAFARGQGEEASGEFDLATVIHEVASEAPSPVEIQVTDSLPFVGRQGAMKRCLTNIVDNACRYGHRTVLEGCARDGSIIVTLDDDGPGIPEASRQEAFQPFVRLDSSRDPNLSGGGLGLTIAGDVVRGHGGDIILASSPLGGLRVQITLPNT